MASAEPMESQISKVTGRYSLLFTLPSQRAIYTCQLVLCFIGGSVILISREVSEFSLMFGLFLGTSIFFLSLLADFLSGEVLMSSDPVLNLRRFSFLSIPSCLILFMFVSGANVVGISDTALWVKIVSGGFFSVLVFRLFVLSTVSSVDYGKTLTAALMQPTFSIIILLVFWPDGTTLSVYSALPFLVSLLLAVSGTQIFVSLADAAGKQTLGVRSLSLFRAFLANWTEDLNEPLENFFEKLGEERDIRVSLLGFKTRKGMKALMIVPVIHPGPFRNVGSSPLPHMIQEKIENKTMCIVSVPHGPSGHDLDATSQLQNEKILNKIMEFVDLRSFDFYAGPLVRSRVDGANASCQIFGDCAVLTLTLAPETMEDLPRELDYAISSEARKRGLAAAITIDAHNSIQGPFDPEEMVEPLRQAGASAMEKALVCERHPLHVGAAKVSPKEFGVAEGMGPGGISVIVIKVAGQKTAYVTIDGNNIVSGLRERILSKLKSLGISEGEVLTTDTHIVSGIIKEARGYHPIGEETDHERLIKYIAEAASEALGNLEPAEVSWRSEYVRSVKIIGRKQLNDLCLLTDRTMTRVKRVAVVLFPAMAILLTLILTFL